MINHMLRHRAVIEPVAGQGPFGPLYDPPVTVRCAVEDTRRLVRDAEGNEVVSRTTLYCPPGTAAPEGSKVTVNGRRATVITVSVWDRAPLPGMAHVELALT